MTSEASRLARWLRERQLTPKRAWGQNFLVDPRLAERIATVATTPPRGTVLEVGAGLGALTGALLVNAAAVVAVERDRNLFAALSERFAAARGLELVRADAMRLDWQQHLATGPAPHVVAGNLPYVITGRVLERTVTLAPTIHHAVFMLQREVANRLLAAPGGRRYGALSVFAQAAFNIERVAKVGPGAFFPRPQVASTVVCLRPLPSPRAVESEAFRRVVKAAFQSRRKTLRNAWRQLCSWAPGELENVAAGADVRLDARAETLPVEAFARVTAEIERRGHTFRP